MRCALGFITVIALFVGVVGCGTGDDADSGYSYQRSIHAEGVALESRETTAAPSDATPARAVSEPKEGTERPASRDDGDTATALQARSRMPATQFRPGTLTAGSIDDNADFDGFRSYLSDTLQQNPGREFPGLTIGRRITIRVENEQGEGIGDARVSIHSLSSDNTTSETLVKAATKSFDMTTGSDGRVLFLSGRDAPAAGPNFLLTVQPSGNKQSVEQRVSLDQPEWTVTLSDVPRRLPVGLDLALVIDTTGSMKDELEYLKVEIDDIAAAVHKRFPNVDQRFSLVLYRDEDDEYVTRTIDFTGSLDEFRQKLSAQSAAGGGDYPEAMHLALEQAGKLSWRRADTARVLFLVGDAPPHSRFADRTMRAVENLRTAGVTVFPVAASGVHDEAEWVMRSAAFLTLGRYLFLTDHSGIGSTHAKPHASRYEVERLNALMIRMIACELAGKELLPSDIIATEREVSSAAPQQNQIVIPPPTYYQPTTTDVHVSLHPSALETAGQWFQECTESFAVRIFLAAIAIGLIWSLDHRRRHVTA